MAGSLTPEATGASDDTGEVAYRPTGTGTPNDGRKARGVVLVDTTGNPYSASGGGGGGGAVTIADGADTALGAIGDLSTDNTLIGRIKNLLTRIPTALGQQTSAASLGVVIASDQGALTTNATIVGTPTVTANVGTGTQPVSGTVTANAGSGTMTISGVVTNSNLDVGLSTRLKPADTLAAVTTVGAVTAITNALPAGTNAIGTVGLKSQITATTTMQSAVTANGNGTVVTTDGYNGALQLFISNGAGTATLTIQGSLDSAFTTAQDAVTLGLYKLTDSGAGTNINRPIVSGALAIAANTSYLFGIADSFPNIRAVVSAAASLGAGTNVTGLTVKLYQVPV